MKLALRMPCVVFLLLGVCATGLSAENDGIVQGVVTDVQDARISDATLTFTNKHDVHIAQTRDDGTYSIKLKSGTYALKVTKPYFWELRRAAFVLNKRSTLRFDFQMWVSTMDSEGIHYQELEKVAKSRLRPLILFGKNEQAEGSVRFIGAATFNVETRQARRYPTILTFNLLTVRGDELIYNPSCRLVTVRGNVFWENGDKSGKADSVTISLNRLDPTPTSPD
jgi:hypothetical protein